MILAIDQGTSGTTCLVFDGEGRIGGRAYREFTQHFPRPGWVEHESGPLADELLPAGLAQLVAAAGGAAVLPDDRPVQRLAAVAVPGHDRLALVGDPDAGQPAAVDAGRVERLARDRARDVPDLGDVVLDPARLREVLGELAVGAADQLSLEVEHEAGRAGRSLVDREQHQARRR